MLTDAKQQAFRRAEKAVKDGHEVGGGTCRDCGHTWACHWPGGCIRHGCRCDKRLTEGRRC